MIIAGHLLLDPYQTPTLGWIMVKGDRIEIICEGNPPSQPDLGGQDAIISPGFIDAHMHFPQFDAIGADGLELLDWLHTTIYPAEIAWADKSFAYNQSDAVVKRLIQSGTLGCCAFLTSHPHALDAARAASEKYNFRLHAGRVMMDRNCPHELCNPTNIDAKSVSSFSMQADTKDRFWSAITPRFAISCTPELLVHAGRLATQNPHQIVQTHLAESKEEVAQTKILFPDSSHYTEVYNHFGLLGKNTLLAHALHLSDMEWRLIADTQSTIVHCPVANVFLKSGVFNLNKVKEYNIRLALGSDIAAGVDIAMPRVARSMIEMAKYRQMTVDPDAYIPTPEEAWRLITEVNADTLGWHDTCRLSVGAAADLLVLNPPRGGLPDNADNKESCNKRNKPVGCGSIISRLIYDWDDSLIRHIILAGKNVTNKLYNARQSVQ